MSKTDRSEHSAYSNPPMAAIRCDVLVSRSNDSCRILLAYVETMLIPDICCAACMKTPMATRWNVLLFPMSSISLYEKGASSACASNEAMIASSSVTRSGWLVGRPRSFDRLYVPCKASYCQRYPEECGHGRINRTYFLNPSVFDQPAG